MLLGNRRCGLTYINETVVQQISVRPGGDVVGTLTNILAQRECADFRRHVQLELHGRRTMTQQYPSFPPNGHRSLMFASPL